jgi:hypothetical protein
MNINRELAQKTGELNNIGVDYYANDDIEYVKFILVINIL